VVDDASFGGASWFPPGIAAAQRQSLRPGRAGGSPTHYLKATNFGFNIPSPAQILGIQVFVERKAVAGRSRTAAPASSKPASSAPRARPPSQLADARRERDLWQYLGPVGNTWTPADINNAGFGFALSVTDTSTRRRFDHISITVTTLCARRHRRSAAARAEVDPGDQGQRQQHQGQARVEVDQGPEHLDCRVRRPDGAGHRASIALCVYDNTGALGQMLVAPGTGWQPISTKGWKFLQKSGVQDGIQKIILKASTSLKSKALVKGKGSALPDITPALTLPVTVQLVNSESGICWQSVFTTSIKNVAGQFKAKDQ
jgi:hypothetical protein